MRIHGSSEYGPKAEVTDGKRKASGVEGVAHSASAKPVQDITQGAPRAAQRPNAVSESAAREAVVLSATAARVSEVNSEQEAARTQRLSEVQKLLDEGKYEVDYESLADSLLAEEVGAKS